MQDLEENAKTSPDRKKKSLRLIRVLSVKTSYLASSTLPEVDLSHGNSVTGVSDADSQSLSPYLVDELFLSSLLNFFFKSLSV